MLQAARPCFQWLRGHLTPLPLQRQWLPALSAVHSLNQLFTTEADSPAAESTAESAGASQLASQVAKDNSAAASSSVFLRIGNAPNNITREDLVAYFKGTVKASDIEYQYYGDGERGFTWLRFESQQAKAAAVKALKRQGHHLGSRKVFVDHKDIAAYDRDMTNLLSQMGSGRIGLVLCSGIEDKASLRDILLFLRGYNYLPRPVWFLDRGQGPARASPGSTRLRQAVFQLESIEEAYRLVRERHNSPLLTRRVSLKVM